MNWWPYLEYSEEEEEEEDDEEEYGRKERSRFAHYNISQP